MLKTLSGVAILLGAALIGMAFSYPLRPRPPEQTSEEWTFEQAKRCWTPMTRAVQHVGVPGYQWQAGVMWDGSVLFGPLDYRQLADLSVIGDNLLHLCIGFGEPMRFLDRQGTGSPLIRKWLEDGRLPIPTLESTDGRIIWQETVFSHLLGRKADEGMAPRSDDLLIVHLLFRVRNSNHWPQQGHLWLYLEDTSKVHLGYKCGVAEGLGKGVAHELRNSMGFISGRVRYVIPEPVKGTLRQHESVSPQGAVGPAKKAVEWSITLAPGEEAEIQIIIPYGSVEKVTGERLLALDSAPLLGEVRRYWRELLYRRGRITTPDPFINDYLVAVAGQMAQQVAFRHNPGIWMYKTSPNHYEGYWPCNAAKALPTFNFRGLVDINRPVLRSFIDMQTDDIGGLDRDRMGGGTKLAGEGYERRFGFLGNFGEWTANPLLLSHGLGMWALAAHYRITRDEAWLREGPRPPLQAMIAAFDWVAAQRRRTMHEADGHKVPHWGLLPAASAHDWLAGNTIFNDAYCIYGMAEVVRLLREIKHPRAEEMKMEVAAYRACLRDRYAAARDLARRVPLPDGTTIPYVPRIVQELDWSKIDWTYTGYGPLRAGAWGALDPDDELVDQSLAFLEAGIPMGEPPIFEAHLKNPGIADLNWADVSDPAAERHFLWRHYVEYETMWPIGCHLFLARDDLPRFFEWLFHNLAAVLHHDWRVGVESLDGVPSCAPGDAERWQAVRRMFVNERGGHDGSNQELFLLQAVPRSWLRPDNNLSVHKMGTHFGGTIDLEVRMAADGASASVLVHLDLAVSPTEIRMRLRSGDGRALRSATINGKAAKVGVDDTISLPSKTSGRYEIIGRFIE